MSRKIIRFSLLTTAFIFLLMGTILGQNSISRKDLKISDSVWNRACSSVGYANKKLGYTPEEMANFPEHPYKLRKITNLFADIREVPDFSGLIADTMLENKSNPAEIVNSCYRLLDTYAARGFEVSKGDNWDCDLIPDGTSPKNAINFIIRENNPDLIFLIRDKWGAYPEGYQRFIIKVLVASYLATPFIQQAFDEKFLMLNLGITNRNELSASELYRYASAPFRDEEAVPKLSFTMLDNIDMQFMMYGNVAFFSHVQSALDELKKWQSENTIDSDIPTIIFDSIVGRVEIIGTLDMNGKKIEGGVKPLSEVSFLFDISSDTNYTDFELNWSYAHPISAIFDFGGNDRYGNADEVAGLGAGVYGIRAIYDFQGNDIYECSESGIGCGWYGTGLVIDYAGNDRYITHKSWGQGAGHAGVGILIDLEGDDTYLYGDQSQGLGSTLGVGLLIDASGNDKYLHTEEVRKTAYATERSREPAASLSQGCGFGRRADFSDGHSLAGGFGIMIEGGGDDEYEGLGRFAQGTGYWWGMGILEDYGGNDKYIGYWYAQGASAHFGIGCHVDLMGDDIYNNEYAKSQTLGNGRDGSLAVFIDGSGDDHYTITNRSAGVGDLNGIGLFWDREGNDYYKVQTCEVMKKTPVIGAATTQSGLERTFRETMPSIGIFLDTGGEDIYDDEMYVDQFVAGRKLQASNNSEWYHNEGLVLWGWGLDTE